MSRQLNPNIVKFQKRDLPINYNNLPITTSPIKLDIRKSKLKERIVCGYGVIWGSKNDYGEIFVKGCFAKSITEHGPSTNSPYKIKLRDRHGKSVALMTKIVEDDIGLYFESAPLDRVSWADDLLIQLESGTINNFSIGFKHCWDRVEWDDENDAMINLEAQLFEISGVDIPSDIETYAVRSAEENEYLQDDIEAFISSLPGSKKLDARKIFTRCLSPLDVAPLNHREKAPETKTPKVKSSEALLTNYLLKNL